MIAKPAANHDQPSDPQRRAGAQAERQMAFYLHRAFATNADLHVLNDLRLVDPEQPDPDGRPGVCQIDHLVLHRFGAFIIESKSVAGEVTVGTDGTGGDEWTRRFQGRHQGFASPIRQAERQGQFLRTFLQRHREELLGKVALGLRTLTKLIAGADQRGFRFMPIQIIVAISDNGTIRRLGKWKEPGTPFQTFVCKADLVPDKIREQFEMHRSGGALLGQEQGQYGVWSMKPEELAGVSTFLVEHHTPRRSTVPVAPRNSTTPPTATTNPLPTSPPSSSPPNHIQHKAPPLDAPACKVCGGAQLAGMWGKYGYYWRCNACSANTAMPTTCSACGAKGYRGDIVRIRKEDIKYIRECASCNTKEEIWTDR